MCEFPYFQPRTVGYLYPDHLTFFLRGGDQRRDILFCDVAIDSLPRDSPHYFD